MQGNDHGNADTTVLGATGAFVTIYPGQVVMYQITEQDLDNFASGMRSVFTGLASSCVSIAISVGLLLALNSDISGRLESAMLGILTATALLGLVFGGFAVREFWSHRRKLRDFKRNAARRPSAS